jgi:hypothetical protein
VNIQGPLALLDADQPGVYLRSKFIERRPKIFVALTSICSGFLLELPGRVAHPYIITQGSVSDRCRNAPVIGIQNFGERSAQNQ